MSTSSSDQRDPGVEAMGISTFTRGCRAGRNKQQPIRRITGHRPSSAFVCRQHSVNSANLASLRIPPSTPNNAPFVNVALLNARSVCNKALQINEYLVKQKRDVLAITETWLRKTGDEVVIVEVTPLGFLFQQVARSSRRRGGGVAILHRDTFSAKILSSPNLDTVELIRL